MLKAKLRWPSAPSARVAVTAELICDAVSVVRPLIWYHSSFYCFSFSSSSFGVSCPFPCLISTVRPCCSEGYPSSPTPSLNPTFGSWTKMLCERFAHELDLTLKPPTAAVVSALKSRKRFTHLPSGTSTAGSMKLLFSVFALPSSQWYTIGLHG